MDCLLNYIGLTGCGSSTPASGLFVNSLPGISLKSVEQLADAEQQTYLGVWADVQTRALKRFELLLNSELSKEYKLRATKYTIKTKYENYPFGSPTTTSFAEKPSILIESNCGSELNFHHIKSIFFQAPTLSMGVTFTFWDYDTKQILDSYSSTAFNAVSEFIIEKKFYCHKLIIQCSYNQNAFYTDFQTEKIYSDCVDISFGLTNALPDSFTNTNKNYGLSILYSNKCSWSSIVCKNKEAFTMPLWYMLGSELMMERMVSDRINRYTVDKKQAEELKAYYDSETEKSMKQAIAGISLESCDCCLECDPLIAIRESLP